MGRVKFLLKRQCHPLLMFLVSLPLIIASFALVNHYKQQIVLQYTGITRVAEKQPSWPKARVTTASIHSPDQPGEPTGSEMTSQYITSGVSSSFNSTTKESGPPAGQSSDSSNPALPPYNPPTNQPNSPPQAQPAPLICVLGVCI
jgi:hypothetical protein